MKVMDTLKIQLGLWFFNPLKIDQDFVDYRLSPSKSHLIRVLGLTLLTGKEVLISGVNGAGLDALAMRRCCIQMGMKIIDLDEDMNALSNGTRFVPPQNTCYWKASSSGIEKPISVLNAENSGTALRLLDWNCIESQISSNAGWRQQFEKQTFH